jgi:hypothetical protein
MTHVELKMMCDEVLEGSVPRSAQDGERVVLFGLKCMMLEWDEQVVVTMLAFIVKDSVSLAMLVKQCKL